MRALSVSAFSLGVFALAIASAGVFGCSSGDSKGSGNTAGSAGEGGNSGGTSNKGGNGGTSNKGGTSGANSSGGASGGTSACTPGTSVDLPDSAGKDTNCDGIDGTAATSVFVAPTGLDSGAGTKDDPVRTINKAVQLAQASNGRLTAVIICSSTYTENVSITGSSPGLYGGYDCNSWARIDAKPLISPSSGMALKLSGATGSMDVARLSFKSADATQASESSQAVMVFNSGAVHFDQCLIAAGRGGNGTDGKAQTQSWNGAKQAAAAAKGEAVIVGTDGSIGCHDANFNSDVDFDGKSDTGPDQALARCTAPRAGGDSAARFCSANGSQVRVVGGKGGAAAVSPLNATPIAAASGGTGEPSSTSPVATNGTPGKGFGALADDGYHASNTGTDGIDGQPGFPGLGGNGGGACLIRQGTIDTTDVAVTAMTGVRAGFTCSSAFAWGTEPWVDKSLTNSGRDVSMFPGSGGGQGGFGGCGGYKGFGGGAGGASIALIVTNSDVSLTWSDLTTSDGGNGGTATDGTAGQAGGDGGAGGDVLTVGVNLPTVNGATLILESNLKGSQGTSGGAGQKGGAGAPGGGGPSIGVLWQGPTDPLVDSTVTIKTGKGGNGGTAVVGDPGAAGISANKIQPVAQ